MLKSISIGTQVALSTNAFSDDRTCSNHMTFSLTTANVDLQNAL